MSAMHTLNALASSEQTKRPLSPFADPTCAACTGERCHTAEEWKKHPLAGHGYSKETGWTHPEAERLHAVELEAANAKLTAYKITPEANDVH